MERWPISRDFVREIPEEEKRASVYANHQSLSLLSEMQDEDLSLKSRHESVVMAMHTGAVLKNNLRRYVPDLVVHQNSTQGPTGSRVGSQQFHDHERPAEGAQHLSHVTAEVAENRFWPENVIRLREILNSVMLRTNKYEKARRVLARILLAHKKSIPVGGRT